MDNIKTIHELLDSNGVGLEGECLLSRVSEVVAEWKQLKTMREAMQKAIWDDDNVRLALEELCHDHFDGCPCKGCAALEATLGKKTK